MPYTGGRGQRKRVSREAPRLVPPEHCGIAIAAGGGSGRRLSAILTVPDAPTALEACTDAVFVVRKGLATAGLQVDQEIGVEAITDQEADRRLAEPLFPDLVAATEAARILGVSRQRVHQLYRDNPRSPSRCCT